MKLLLLVFEPKAFDGAKHLLENELKFENNALNKVHLEAGDKSIFSAYKKGAEFIDLLQAGESVQLVSQRLTAVLSNKRYHLCLAMGFCKSLIPKLKPHLFVNVISETAVHFFDEPETNEQQRFINRTNSYFNVFVDYYKVLNLTINKQSLTHHSNVASKAFTSSYEGVAVQYHCLKFNQAFYQIRLIIETEDAKPAEYQLLLQETQSVIEKIK